MYLSTQQQLLDVQDEDVGAISVGYGDDGLQAQLLKQLNKAHGSTQADARAPRPISSTLSNVKPTAQCCRGLSVLQRQGSPPLASPSRQKNDIHDLLGEVLTQVQFEPDNQQQAHHQVLGVVQYVEQEVAGQEPEHPAQDHHHREQGLPPSAAAVFKSNQQSNQQMLDALLQPQQQPTATQITSQHVPQQQGAPSKQQPMQQLLQQQKLKSGRHSTPSRPRSTPQSFAPKKKARFSIKDTPSQASTLAYTTPQPSQRKHAATAGSTGGSADPLAALFGSGGGAGAAPTPSRQPSAAAAVDDGRTPCQPRSGRLTAVLSTPRLGSSSKPPAGSARPSSAARAAAAAAREQTTPLAAPTLQDVPAGAVAATAPGQASAASSRKPPGSVDAAGPHSAPKLAAADVDEGATLMPAALFHDANTNQDHASAPAAAAATAGSSPAVTPAAAGAPPGSSRRRHRASDVNPLELMSASRRQMHAFLQQTAPAAASEAGLAGGQLGNTSVQLGSSLTKVWQQLQAAQKKQQDRLGEQLAAAAKASQQQQTGNGQGVMEVEVVNKSWEAHLVKCLCTVSRPPQQLQQVSATQQGQQQQQYREGDQVFVFLNSKLSHSVELAPRSKVKLHPPWYEIVQRQPDAPPVLLAYLIS